MQFIQGIDYFIQKNNEFKEQLKNEPAPAGGKSFIVDEYQSLCFYATHQRPQTERMWQNIQSLFLEEKHLLNKSTLSFEDVNNMFFFHINSFTFFKNNGFDFSQVKDEKGQNFNDYIKQIVITFTENINEPFKDSRLMYNGAVKSVIFDLTKEQQACFFHYKYLNKNSFKSTYHFDETMTQEELNLGLKISLEFDQFDYANLYLDNGAKAHEYIKHIEFEVSHPSAKIQALYEKLLFDYQNETNNHYAQEKIEKNKLKL